MTSASSPLKMSVIVAHSSAVLADDSFTTTPDVLSFRTSKATDATKNAPPEGAMMVANGENMAGCGRSKKKKSPFQPWPVKEPEVSHDVAPPVELGELVWNAPPLVWNTSTVVGTDQ